MMHYEVNTFKTTMKTDDLEMAMAMANLLEAMGNTYIEIDEVWEGKEYTYMKSIKIIRK